jgi:hypothetical protein
MPPLWLIAGAIISALVSHLFSEAFVKPRATRHIVEGREVFVPRARERVLQGALMFACLAVLMGIGVLMEGPFILVAGIPLLLFMALPIFRAAKLPETAPTTEEIQKGQELTRRGGLLVVFGLVDSAIGAIGVAIGGTVGFVIVMASVILGLVGIWHAFRFLRFARSLRPDGSS